MANAADLIVGPHLKTRGEIALRNTLHHVHSREQRARDVCGQPKDDAGNQCERRDTQEDRALHGRGSLGKDLLHWHIDCQRPCPVLLSGVDGHEDSVEFAIVRVVVVNLAKRLSRTERSHRALKQLHVSRRLPGVAGIRTNMVLRPSAPTLRPIS